MAAKRMPLGIGLAALSEGHVPAVAQPAAPADQIEAPASLPEPVTETHNQSDHASVEVAEKPSAKKRGRHPKAITVADQSGEIKTVSFTQRLPEDLYAWAAKQAAALTGDAVKSAIKTGGKVVPVSIQDVIVQRLRELAKKDVTNGN